MDSVLTQYIQDSSIPLAKRQSLASDLDSGNISESDAKGIITTKYAGKYKDADKPTHESVVDALSMLGGTRSSSSTPSSELSSPEDSLKQAINKHYPKGMPQEVKDKIFNAVPKSLQGLASESISKGGVQTAKDKIAKAQGQVDFENEQRKAVAHRILKGMNPVGSELTEGIMTAAGGLKDAVVNQAEVGMQLPGAIYNAATKGEDASPELVRKSQKAFGGVENVVAGGMQAGFAPVTGTIEALPDQVKNPVKQVMNLPNDAAAAVARHVAKQINPNLSDDEIEELAVKPTLQAFQLGTIVGGPKIAKKTGEVVKAVKEAAGAFTKKAGQFIGKTGEQVAAEAAKVSPETIGMAKSAPELVTKAQKQGAETNRAKTFEMAQKPIDKKIAEIETRAAESKQGVFNKAKAAIDTKLDEFSETGKQYNPIKELKTAVDLSDGKGNSIFEKFAEKKGLKYENGKFVADKGSAIRNQAELARFNNLYDVYGKYTEFTPQEFLNFRRDVGDLGKFGEGITTDLSALSEQFYGELNAKGRPQLKGLQELDARFAPLKKDIKDIKNLIYDKDGNVKPAAFDQINDLLGTGEARAKKLKVLKEIVPEFDDFIKNIEITAEHSRELKQIKKLIYDADGNMKDNAISQINNLFNKGNEQKLKRLKEVIPDFDEFTKQVKITKVVEDIEGAKNVKVAFYKRGQAPVVGAVLGSILGGPVGTAVGVILSEILTNPTVVLGLVKKYGKTKANTGALIGEISKKVQEGKKLTAPQMNFIKESVKNIPPEVLQSLVVGGITAPKKEN